MSPGYTVPDLGITNKKFSLLSIFLIRCSPEQRDWASGITYGVNKVVALAFASVREATSDYIHNYTCRRNIQSST